MAAEAPGKRMVRLEKESYPEDIQRSQHSGFLIESNASAKRKMEMARAAEFAQQGKPGAAKSRRDEAAKFKKSLDVAVGGPSKDRDALRKKHMVSSASSPFLSGTPSFTTGQNSQLSYMDANLRKGKTQVVTIHQSTRAIDNPHNKREAEVLVPHGEKANERVGMLHVQPIGGKVRPIFIDKSGDKPKLYVGASAVARFKVMSQK